MAAAERTSGPFVNHLADEITLAGFATHRAFAEQAGLDPAVLSRLVTGKTLAGPDELDAILTALRGIPASRIYDRPFLEAIGAARRAVQA